jgi:hypothetical protein
MTAAARIAFLMRKYADRIDNAGAPKYLSWSFTFERGLGMVFRQDGKGCPLVHYGDADYERAHAEADNGV